MDTVMRFFQRKKPKKKYVLPSNPPAAITNEHLRDARLFACRDDMIASLRGRRFDRIAEIGVAFGDFSRVLIETLEPSEFHAFDLFHLHEAPMFWGKPTAPIFKGLTHQEYYERNVRANRLITLKGDSSEQLESIPDAHYDLIYVDGEHRYGWVCKDAAEAARTVKEDGIIIFNDYIMHDHIAGEDYGVVYVVNDMCVNGGWRITGLALQNMMFCDIMLTR